MDPMKIKSQVSPITTFIADLPSNLIPQPRNSPSPPSTGPVARRLVIVGDVHGARRSLEVLLEKLGFDRSDGDHLILVGDLVNKGPDSPGVIDLAIKLGASAIRGNHDNAVLVAAAAIESAKIESALAEAASGNPSLSEKPDEDAKCETKLPEKPQEDTPDIKPPSTSTITAATLSVGQINWLASLPLMIRVALPSRPHSSLGNLVVVHAGLVPGVPLEQQDPHGIMHMRSLNMSGDAFTPAEEDGEEGWAAAWDRSQDKLAGSGMPTTAVFGHDAKRGLQLRKYSIGLDSACVYGHQLSALPLRQLFPDPSAADTGAVEIEYDLIIYVGLSRLTDILSIVAVHGLNPRSKNATDHAWDTWRTPPGPTGRLWLRDDLPQHIPNSRIFLYQYNATVIYGQDRDTFVGKASELLEALRVEREDIESRPIIFLGHSMGGLLIKQALINAHENKKYASIKDATKGLAFFATPHHGADKKRVGLGSAAAKIATTLGFEKGDGVMETLQAGSIFSEVMQAAWRNQLPDYNVVSFWGAHDKMVPVESAKIGIPGDQEHVVKLNAGHGGVCRFSTSEVAQDNSKLVIRNIRDLYKKALQIGTKQQELSLSSTPAISYPLNSIAPVKTFVQRPALRDKIREQLVRDVDADRKGEVKKVGVWGIGGAGKSQLALSYLQKYRADYDGTFWIQAGQTASIDQDFLAIYRLLPNREPQQSVPKPEDIKQAVLAWFITEPGKRLIIFDGADHLNATDKGYVALSQYIPASSDVHIIITSRSLIAKSLSSFDGVLVGELDNSQSVDLFLNCAEISPSRENVVIEAEAIAEEMGHLALAISMAGKYVSQTPRVSSNLPAYLEDFRIRRHRLLSEKPDEVVSEYSHSVMTVWETSYAAVCEQLPEACRLLTMLSFIHYEDIFLELFESFPNSDSEPEDSWASILEELAKTLYLQHNLSAAGPMMKVVLQHYQKTLGNEHHDTITAMGNLAAIFMEQGNLKEAESIIRKVLKNRQQTVGNEHHQTITTMNNLSETLRRQGNLKEAESIGRDVLEKSKRIGHNEHPDTITAMNNLSLTLRERGKLDEAEDMAREVLETRRRVAGNEHHHTISEMANLADTLHFQGKLDEAELLKRETLQRSSRILGPSHPLTIAAIAALVNTMRGQGKGEEANSLIGEMLARRQHILPNGHPGKVLPTSGLAIELGGQGKLNDSSTWTKESLEMALRWCKWTRGSQHPDTIALVENLDVVARIELRVLCDVEYFKP
ncbi:hypothetical protein G7Z17_g1046 [Cylindrodendrum hubeiense]|uniref:NB-ARC domain-containing protein n=1 Tax=Cylindrodendrum hubeiense TaxID=595255 RepID=A0A9P5LLS2_9HYPO|nr:hypothetical protein G7Z17_g1046 [Cylindrodendrum hubeiense]